jgi:dTDP-4-dehydrorhamnose 3,5-epimerase
VIEDVQLVELQTFTDERGAVLLMLKETDPHFVRFGEIYFSTVYRGVVKAWKNHRRLIANYACIHGRVKVALHDTREGSGTRGQTMEVHLSPQEYALLVIPAGVWHGFQGLGEPLSILANCATAPSDPDELERLDPAQGRIPYEWVMST